MYASVDWLHAAETKDMKLDTVKNTDGGGIRANQRAHRRRALIEAARAEFMANGYAQTTLSDIIARSGGSRSTIYKEFGNKADLFKAVGLSYAEEMHDRLTKRLQSSSEDLRETLLEYGLLYVEAGLQSSAVQLMRCGILEAPSFPELADAVFGTYVTGSVEPIAAYLDRLKSKGLISVAEPLAAAELFLVMVKGNLQMHAMADPKYRISKQAIADQVTFAVNVFVKGLGHPNASEIP